MAPDDLPIETPEQDSTKSPATNPPLKPSIGPEAEVRGGSERAEDPPLEQLRRSERP
jgi:hypothetical protein